MKKAEIRTHYLEKKQQLSSDDILMYSKEIFEKFIEYFQIKANYKVHCFLAIPEKGEVDTRFFIQFFLARNVRLFVPKIVNGQMIALEMNEETELVKSSWGIEEPTGAIDSGVKDYDLVITPLLYADQYGNRVGYGKGFYDRFLSAISPKTAKVGLSFFSPEFEVEDISEFDVTLDYLVTPTDVLSFGSLTSKFTK